MRPWHVSINFAGGTQVHIPSNPKTSHYQPEALHTTGAAFRLGLGHTSFVVRGSPAHVFGEQGCGGQGGVGEEQPAPIFTGIGVCSWQEGESGQQRACASTCNMQKRYRLGEGIRSVYSLACAKTGVPSDANGTSVTDGACASPCIIQSVVSIPGCTRRPPLVALITAFPRFAEAGQHACKQDEICFHTPQDCLLSKVLMDQQTAKKLLGSAAN